MALKATIYKASLQIADLDRQYYADHVLTLARHPSETEQRLMLRLFAFGLFAGERLSFGRGLSTDDEPDLWALADDGEVLHWIDLGQPGEARMRKACGRARRVSIIAYGDRAPAVWWRQLGERLAPLDNLEVVAVGEADGKSLATLAARNLSLQLTVQEGLVWLGDGTRSLEIRPVALKPPRP